MKSKEELREKIKEEREREWIRDSLMLRDKRPEDTLKILFDLCEFADRLNKNSSVKEKDAGGLEEALRKEKFSIQAEDIRDALKERSHFTIFDDLSEYYIDAKGIYNENDRLTLERRRKVSFADFVFYVASPEDTIANKLLFGSEQDVKDAEGIYARQFDNLEMAYLEGRSKKIEVHEEFLTMKRRVERRMKEVEKCENHFK